MKGFRHITIIGRRWFQKTYGNTYHSVTVSVDGVNIGGVEFAYGYGDQYIQSAFEILQNKGYYPKTGEHYKSGMGKDYSLFLNDRMDHREKFFVSVSDVGRKKDL